MKNSKFLLLLVLQLIAPSQSFLTTEQEVYLESLVKTSILEPNNVPGFGFTLVKKIDENGEAFSTYTNGYGFSDLESSVPVFNHTLFMIASISKSFTATVSCKFLSETFPELGESVVDTPISRLAPNYNFTLSDRFRSEQATFRDLFGHRTCLNSYGLGVTSGAYSSREERVYRCRYIEEKCGFRSRFEYSNSMFILAADVISHLSGIPFDDMVISLFQSLGMNDTIIMDSVTDYDSLAGMSKGYYLEPDGILRKIDSTLFNGNSGVAAGGVITSLRDMAKYMEFHLGEGSFAGEEIVRKEVIRWLHTPSNHMEFQGWRLNIKEDYDMGGDFAYGMALNLGSYRGWQRISHDGDLSPFTATMSFFPSQDLGVFSVSNGPGVLPHDSGHYLLRNEVFDMLTAYKTESRQKLIKRNIHKKTSFKRKTGTGANAILAQSELTGLYGHPYEGTFTISLDESNMTYPLSIQYGIRGTGLLVESGEPNVYKIEWFGSILQQLYAYSGGAPLGDMLLDFNTLPDHVAYVDGDGEIQYERNGTLDKFPVIPWDPDSCLVS